MQLIALTLALLLQDEDEFSKPHIEMHRKVSPAVVFVRGGSQTGTGFLVDRRGIVVTSTTAIGATSTTATVQLQGHKQLSAKVVGRADDRELVLLQLETPGTYPHLELGDSDSVRVGQIAYAFGDSFDSLRVDDQCHMSLGVVSGFYDVSQEKTRGSKYKGTVLEVSCAVNQNQDGGPIVDRHGKVIGMTSLNYEESKFTGFAIPVNVLKPEIERVVKGLGGPVVSTSKSDLWVGLEIEETDDGLVVSRVYAKSPAEKSGVKKGDLLVRVNGKKVLTTKTFGDTLAGLKAGDAMQVRVKRNGKDMDLSLTLAKKPVY